MMKPNRGDGMSGRIASTVCAMVMLMLAAIPTPLAASVQASLDRTRVTEGETVTLVFQTDSAKQSLDADFSILERDFIILDRRSETQLSIVSGQQTAVVRLLLTIEPRRAGNLEIPPFTFGTERTQALSVQVDEAPQLEPGAQPPVFIEVEIDPDQGPYYVHAQLGLIVRVFYQQNLTEAAISQPEPSPASVRLMQETPYQAERGGERYRVLERNYAVFPERSGELTIPPMQLTGRLVERRTGSVWQPTVRGRRVRVESEALQLAIDPRSPEFIGSTWLPARDFRLTQQVSTGDSLRVGEPITRTVIVDAVGLEENMIVEPEWPEVPEARIYPDQPQGITRDDGQWVLGHKEFRYAVVPEREGELVLPELRVPWWDTRNNRQQTAVLKAHTIHVGPSALVPPPAQAPATGRDASVTETVTTGPAAAGPSGLWRWLTLLFAALWLLTLAGAWWSRKRGPVAQRGSRGKWSGQENSPGALTELKTACEAGNPGQARMALYHWLRENGPGQGSLHDFAAGIEDETLRNRIHALDSDGYRPDSQAEADKSWDGRSFWKHFNAWRKDRLTANRESQPDITDLYAPGNRIRQ